MSIYQGILLGIIQGLTEFLPVSSSGHLVIVQQLIGFDQGALAFDALLHLGTLVAVIIYFRTEVARIVGSVVKWARGGGRDEYTALSGYLALATIPAGVAGVAFEAFFEDAFESILVVGVMLIVTGLILWLAAGGRESGSKTLSTVGLNDSLWVGLAQMAAILPGLSRSGATISMGIFRGLDRAEAARFSFLLSIPVILGAAVVALKDGIHSVAVVPAAAATVTAGLCGFGAIAVLMKVIREQKLRLFAVYCFIIGSIALVLAFLR